MNYMFEDIGLLCLAVKSGQKNSVGRSKLQKMIYFADRYLGWNVDGYKMGFYGPSSRNVSMLLKTMRDAALVKERITNNISKHSITRLGKQFLDDFINIKQTNKNQIRYMENILCELSKWNREELEIAASIDYVEKTNPNLEKDALLKRVHLIKDNFSLEFINHTYDKLQKWKSGKTACIYRK